VDEIINDLYDASNVLNLIATAADNIASGTASDPERLAVHVRQTAWALADLIGRHINLLEIHTSPPSAFVTPDRSATRV
jgi:hypothetical protein